MKTRAFVYCLLILLSACASEVGKRDFDEAADSHFGQAVRENIAAQIANPDAPSSQELQTSGARAAVAQERYKTDQVEKPSNTNTLDIRTTGTLSQ